MRIQYSQNALMTTDEKGKLVPRVGPFQKELLQWVMKLDETAPPPPGLITGTGKLRKHILEGMVPLGLLKIRHVDKEHVDYVITPLGELAAKKGQVDKGVRAKTKKAASPILLKQRSKAKARKPQRGRARRAA